MPVEYVQQKVQELACCYGREYTKHQVDIWAPGGTWGGGGKNKLEQQTVMEKRNTLTKYDMITKFHALGCSNMFSFPIQHI